MGKNGAGAELVAAEGEGQVLDWLAAPELEPPKTPGELVRQAVEQHLPSVVDGLAQLAASATNEDVRLRAIKAMLDLSVALGIVDAGAGTLESFVRAMGGSGGGVVAMIPGRED